MDIPLLRTDQNHFCCLANKQLTKRQNVVLQLEHPAWAWKGLQCPHFSVKGDRFCCSLALHLTSLPDKFSHSSVSVALTGDFGFMDIHKSLYCLEWLCIWTVYPLKAWMASSAFRRLKQPGSRTHTQPCSLSPSVVALLGNKVINCFSSPRKSECPSIGLLAH